MAAVTVRPRAAAGAAGDWWGWGIAAAIAAAAGLSTAVWVAGRLASLAAGGGLAGPPWSMFLGFRAASGDTRALWPAAPTGLVWVLTAVLMAVALAAVTVPTVRVLRWATSTSPLRSLAKPKDLAEFTPAAAAAAAVRMRPSLAGRPASAVRAEDQGVALGRMQLPSLLRKRWLQLVANWEQTILAVFAPRTGKTSALAVTAVLNAPGAAVATSNKADLVATTAALREHLTDEQVWVFDPQQIMHVEQAWTWNPLAGDLTFDDITRLAAAFVLTVDSGARGDIWAPAARELIANLLLAAHHAGLTLMDAYAWLMDEKAKMPVQLLRRHGFDAAAKSLAGTQAMNDRTRSSVYWAARTALSCLRDPGIARWVTPQPGLPAFDPQRFVASRQTLYLLSKDASGGTTAGPLVAALTDRVRLCAERLGESNGGRMDPPLLLVLDEAANIARIDDLPALYSHLGSRSIIVLTILQSYAQGEGVWGKDGMKALWGAATVKLFGPGADDSGWAEEMSRLIGEHDVDVLSYSSGRHGHSRSAATRRERIIPPDALRAMRKGTAVLLATGVRPAAIELQPWYRGPLADRVQEAKTRAEAELTQRAKRRSVRPERTPAP